ncbi:MAG: Maf family protein [Candidatus Fimenecus sp.]
MSGKYKLVLASKSPRRSEILKNAGFEFIVRAGDADETLPDGITPENAVVYLAEIKAQAVSRASNELVLGADTVVVLDGKILGKPKDEKEAFTMLSALSGRTHSVLTGVCALTDNGKIAFYERTEVVFATLTDKEIADYISTKDCYDKAGSYGIQGYASRFITGINGDYFNVVGLPLCKIYEKILKNGQKLIDIS